MIEKTLDMVCTPASEDGGKRTEKLPNKRMAATPAAQVLTFPSRIAILRRTQQGVDLSSPELGLSDQLLVSCHSNPFLGTLPHWLAPIRKVAETQGAYAC